MKAGTTRPPKDDLTGRRFNRLLVKEYAGRDKAYKARWLCICDCGSIKDYDAWAIKSGHTKACSSCRIESVAKARTTSRKGNYQTYYTYVNMLTRCHNPKHKAYYRYGGRGITICSRWLESFDNFFEDMGRKPEWLTLDRINNDGNYEPDNCRWADSLTQMRNSTATKLTETEVREIKMFSAKGLSAAELSTKYSVSKSAIYAVVSGQNWKDV